MDYDKWVEFYGWYCCVLKYVRKGHRAESITLDGETLVITVDDDTVFVFDGVPQDVFDRQLAYTGKPLEPAVYTVDGQVQPALPAWRKAFRANERRHVQMVFKSQGVKYV